MAWYTVGGSATIVGTKATDTYIVDPLQLVSASITDPGGTRDTLWINMRHDLSWDAEFGTVGGRLVWRDLAGHQVQFALNADGSSPIELFKNAYVAEFGWTDPRIVTERVLLAGHTLTDTDISFTGVAVLGTSGNDVISAPTVTGSPAGNHWNCEIFGNLGNDTLVGSSTADFILHGGRGNDVLSGQGTMDVSLYGGVGNDILTGAGGYDDLEGGAGNDKLNGGAGGDYIWGESGNDTMAGGAGGDTFEFSVLETGHDRITDYDKTSDQLQFVDLTAADLAIVQIGSDALITVSGGAQVTVLHTLVADLHITFY